MVVNCDNTHKMASINFNCKLYISGKWKQIKRLQVNLPDKPSRWPITLSHSKGITFHFRRKIFLNKTIYFKWTTDFIPIQTIKLWTSTKTSPCLNLIPLDLILTESMAIKVWAQTEPNAQTAWSCLTQSKLCPLSWWLLISQLHRTTIKLTSSR